MAKPKKVRSNSYHRSIKPKLTIQQAAQPRLKKDGTVSEPHIIWDKKKCFALALAVDHQKQERQSDKKWCNHWKSILAVVNTVYLQEFPDFTAVYPNGLPNPNKLRTEYSDRYRVRESKKWKTKKIDCSDEVVELERIAEVVLQVETDLCNAGVQKVRDHRAEAMKPDGVPATRWPSDNEIRTPETCEEGSTAAPTDTGETPTQKPKKRKRKEDESNEEKEEKGEGSDNHTPAPVARSPRKRRAVTVKGTNSSHRAPKFDSDDGNEEPNDDRGEDAPAATARPTRKPHTASIERMDRPRRASNFASYNESDAEDDDSASDEDDASIARPTTSHTTAVGERSSGPDQTHFEFNYDLSDDGNTATPDHNAANDSDEENNDTEHGKYDAAYVRITTGNKTVVSEGSSGSRHSYNPKYGSDVSNDDNESSDGESVNEGDEDDATAEATATDKGDAEMGRAMLLGATTALPTTAPGAAGGVVLSDAGNMLDTLLHGYADTPQPPVFAPRANTTAAGNNATGNTIDLTNTTAAGNDAARETIDLTEAADEIATGNTIDPTNNQRSTKNVRFDKTAARDAAIDLTNDEPEPKMKSSLPSGDNHGLTDDDLAFDDPFGLNEHEQTYAHVDAVQDLDPNFLRLDQVPGIRPQQSRPQQSRPQQHRTQQSRPKVNSSGDLPAWTNGNWDDPDIFGEDTRIARPTTKGKTVVGEHSSGPRHTYDFDSNDQAVNDVEDNELPDLQPEQEEPQGELHVPKYDQQVSMYMQRDAGWQPHNAAIAASVQKYSASFGLNIPHDTAPTVPVAVSFPSVKRTLITAMQACRWDQVLGVILEIPGVEGSKWSHERDLINPLALSTCVKYEDVAEAVFQATNSMSTSSFGLQILFATPTGTLPTRGTNADIEHLNTILNGIHARVEMSMIHTKDVDFTALVPTCFARFTSQPFQPLVTVGCDLYNHGGEVRRVLLQDDLTGQIYEVDLMLCDPKFCHDCGATADACPPISFNDSARQPVEHPRVHHKDVFMLEDTRLAFAPREQMPPCDAPGFDHREVHEVMFNGGKMVKAMFCKKVDCLACQIETTPSSLVWQSSH
jgi:hypothetical protein